MIWGTVRALAPESLKNRLRKFVWMRLNPSWTLNSGLVIRVLNYNDWMIYNDIFVEREYDAAIEDLLRETDSPRPLQVLDLGGNVGFFTLRLAHLLLQAGRSDFRVTMVEGSPSTYPELLERLGQIKFIHRDVASIAEAENYLKKWSQRRYDDYVVLYIATHGDKGKLRWGPRENMTLDELAKSLGDTASSCWVYLGSCLTLFNEREVRRFVEQTGVEAVLGYRKEVDWIESAAFDVILLSEMANFSGRPATFFKSLTTRYGELAAMLKLVVGTKTDVLHAAKVRKTGR